ncbi:MAG: response regulator transcription factor [Acidobacteriota bacterium]|nr:response regulator transcription factor [Acidobacteriota bacterium]
MVRVLVVEDSKVARDAILRWLGNAANYEVAAALENAANAVVACMGGHIDLVLMDVCTADDESGLAAAARIKEISPGTRVVIMTSMPEHSFVAKARAAHCDSFWYKEYGETGLLDVIEATMRGEPVWPDETPTVTLGILNSAELTRRELDVIRLLAQGCTYEEIAADLTVSINTVKYHIKNLLTKTGFRSTLQLVVEAVDKGFVLPKY